MFVIKKSKGLNSIMGKIFSISRLLIIILVCIVIYFSVVRRESSTSDPNRHVPSTRKGIECSLVGANWIVVTTIFYPSDAIHRFLTLKSQWNLIVIADQKTPTDWLQRLNSSSSRLLFISVDQQKELDFRILRFLPYGSYARKNIGYLIAIKCGAKIIFESDDDNLLETDDVYLLPKVLQPQQLPWIAFHRERSPLVNIYGSFGHPQIWPRGFPIDEIRNVTEDGWHSVRQNVDQNTNAYIQQYLADLDPDVDAIYRLAHPMSIGRIHFDRDQPPIALQPFTFSPYNTQNTVTYYEAFWGLYLPVTTTFRVCDIWRGYWVQRLLWDIGGRLIFGRSTVKQIRNSHSYIKDMDDESQLYHQSGSFVRFLSSWSSSRPSLYKRIAQLARDVAEGGFWDWKEVSIMDAWLADLESVGYSFPSIVESSSPSSTPVERKRTAVCITGLAECFEKSWTETYRSLHSSFIDNIDTFVFVSSSAKKEPIPINNRLKQVRSYRNATITIIYEDRLVDPKIPSNCTTYYQPDVVKSIEVKYFQQLWALNECFRLVKEYEQTMNISYEFFIRLRSDSVLNTTLETLAPPDNSTIIIPDADHFFGYNDRFAIGSMNTMEKYMRRWENLKDCQIKNIHAESFLKSILEANNITVRLEVNMNYTEIPHGTDCH